jgi:iron complex transport system ATP-binding protein
MLVAGSVRCAYDGRDVLGGVSLCVGPGEFVALVGPNGSGKSTLLRTLSRTLRPREGSVTLDGRDLYGGLDAREAARAIAVVPQETPFDFEFSAYEVVMMGRHPHLGRFEPEEGAHAGAARAAMEATGTWEFRDRPVTELSGGERRRVLVARAFAQNPRYLLLDEPVTHLDVRHQVEILRTVKAHGAAVVAVLHDFNLARAYATRAVLLEGGRVAAEGEPARVLAAETLERVFATPLREGACGIGPVVP